MKKPHQKFATLLSPKKLKSDRWTTVLQKSIPHDLAHAVNALGDVLFAMRAAYADASEWPAEVMAVLDDLGMTVEQFLAESGEPRPATATKPLR